MRDAEVTPAMQVWAQSFANDLSIPIGDFTHRKWFGTVPVVAAVLCHNSHADGVPSGLYHGVTLFVATSPEWYPQESHPVALAPQSPDWPYVIGSGVVILAVGTAFLLAIKYAGQR